jgi:hypothetical protein
MITIAWLVATMIFFYYAIIFWNFGKKPLRFFTIRKRFDENGNEIIPYEGENAPTQFLKEFEGYLGSINKNNKFRFRIASGGFIMAGFAALMLALALA